MKKTKRLTLLTCLIFLCLFNPNVRAKAAITDYGADVGISPMNLVIRTCSASISISGNTITSTGTISTYAGTASQVKITLYLQKYSNGSWQTINTYSQTYSSSTAVLSKSSTVTGSGTFRVMGVHSAGGETITVYSSTRGK